MTELSLRTKDSFEQVLGLYSDMVYRLAFSRLGNTADSEDILQEVFLRYVKADKEYESEEHRKAWLIRATLNCTKTLAMSPWHRRRNAEELDDNDEGIVDETLNLIETKSAVYNAVLKLPQKYRTVIHLFYYEDLPITTICKVTGLTENTVKSQLHRARNLLKDELKRVEFDNEF